MLSTGGEDRGQDILGRVGAEEAAGAPSPRAGHVPGMLEEQGAGRCGWSRGSEGRELAGGGGESVGVRPSRALQDFLQREMGIIGDSEQGSGII